MRRILGVGALCAVTILMLAALAGCGGSNSSGTSGGTGSTGGGSSASGADVTMSNFAFSPSSVEIKAGESVTWTNEDSATHTVEGDGGISSGDLAKGQSYTKKFDTAGTYPYKCSIHPSMTGTVVVK